MDTALIRTAAIIGAVCGVYLLQAAWRIRSQNGPRLAGGWALITASLLAWSQTSGADKGAALGLVCLTLVALIFLIRAALQAPPREEREPPDRIAPVEALGWRTIARRAFAGLLIGPLSGIAALVFSAAMFVALHRAGFEHTANLILAMFAFPLAWAGLAVLAGMDNVLWRKSALVLGLGLAPIAYLAISS